jgi:predicted nucleic acid-binding protein
LKAVVNTSPLIFLAKLKFLDALSIYEKVYTTNIVIEEIRKGIDKGFIDGLEISRLVGDKQIEVVDVKSTIEDVKGLHAGERSVIKLAKDLGIEDIIADDLMAIRAAKYLALKPISTPFLLLINVKRGNLSKKRFREMMDLLLSYNYHISPNLYVKILEKVKAL